MSQVQNTIFQDDIAILNLIDIIENGKADFVLATEIEGGCMPAKFIYNGDGTFNLTFKMPQMMFEQIERDFFFTHHMMLVAKEFRFLVQNQDVRSFRQHLTMEEEDIDTSLVINSFRADIIDNLWKDSKQAAFCFWGNKDFHNHKFGVIFDMTTDKNQNSSWKNCVKLEIEKDIFLLYFNTSKDKRHFFVLKSQKEIDHDKFLIVLEAIRVALGLISGYYIADSVWYFAMQLKDESSFTFRYENNDESICNNHPLLDSAPYENLPEQERKLSSSQFEKLAIQFYKNKEMRRSSQLLIQAGNIKGISKGCLAAVALETIKLNIGKVSLHKKELINDKEIQSKLKYELNKGLKKIKNLVNPDVYERLESKIGQINQSSNAEKLEAPFEVLDIKLTDDELYCLSYRNSFLHGATLKPKGDLYKCLNQSELIEIVADRLIMLTAMLLLKKCGYDGNIVDWGYTKVAKHRAVTAMKHVNSGCAFRKLKPDEG